MIELAILVIASTLSFFIGTTVYLKNQKSSTSILFLLLSITLIFWSTVNYFLIRSIDDSASLVLMKMNFITVVLQNTLFYLFSSVFPDNKYRFRVRHKLFIAYSAFVTLLVLLGFVISGFEDGNLVPAPGIALFILHAILAVTGGFRRLYVRHKKHKAGDASITYLIYGSLILWVLVPITNFVLPNVFGINFFVRLSALYVLLFSLVISYAILKHKLFDLRLIVARATGYVFTTLVAIFVYVLFAYLVKILVLPDTQLSRGQLISNVTLVVLLVLVYPSLKLWFDKITNRIFYRDSYDPQKLIDELNQALVKNVELESLLTKSALIIQENLKTSFVTFYIRETSYFKPRIIGAHRRQPEYEELDKLQELASTTGRRVILINESNESEKEKQLKKNIN